jgi:hypothetical protein
LNDSVDSDKFRGADGIVGPFHEKEGSYYAIKEIWSPVYFEKKYITPEFNGTFRIENRYFYTNTSQCRFSWHLKELHNPSFAVAKGSMPSPAISPGQRGILKLDLPSDWRQYDVLFVSAFGPDGKEIFTWSFPIVKPREVMQRSIQKNGTKAILTDADSSFDVSANNINFRFHKRTGALLEVRNSLGLLPLTNGPVVQEAVNNFGNFTARYEADTLVIESTFDRKKNYNTLKWLIYPSGILKMRVNYFPAEYFTWFDGVNFSFPESEIKSVEFMGNGPYRVWKNRLAGNKFGIWKKEYNKTETAEQWVYPEFKGYHSNMYWCKFVTNSQAFTVYTENEDLFFRLFTPAFKTDQWRNYEPLFPGGDISFMQGIPSIGTKNQRAETTGPMGMKNILYDYEKDPTRSLQIILYFDFSGSKKN